MDILRLVSIVSFLVCSLSFTWYSFISLIAVLGKAFFAFLCYTNSYLAVSLYVLDRNKYQPKPATQTSGAFPSKNPYKGKRRFKDESKIPQDVHESYTQLILQLVLDYDAEECQSLRDFEPVKMNTHCIFAKKSILWGTSDYDRAVSLGKYILYHMYIWFNHSSTHTHTHTRTHPTEVNVMR